MEAKDTVMDDGEIRLVPQKMGRLPSFATGEMEWEHMILQAQAEISFKAGVKEVVDWLINDSYDTTIHFGEDWQAQLKEWGIA